MKPGSKTRTRQTLGGGTKTVTKSKSSTGAKTRVVEKSKGNLNSGMETTRKFRRADQGGVRKTVSKSFERGGSNRTENKSAFSKLVKNEKSTLVKKDTFRKKGSLKSKPLEGSNTVRSSSRKADTIGMELGYSSDNRENSLDVNKSGKERGFNKRKQIYTKDYIKKGSMKPKSTKFENNKAAKKEYGSQKEKMSNRISMTSPEKRHNVLTKLNHPSNFERQRSSSSSEVETGKTYTPKRK